MNKATKELSVLICTRNGARTIAEAISACAADLAASNAPAAEVIVVDNGSTDSTPTIIENAQSTSGLEIVTLSVPKPGKIHAFIAGVRAARSDLVCIIDDDNVIEPGYFSRLCGFFASYQDVGVIGGANSLDPRVMAPPWFEWGKHFLACSHPLIEDKVIVDAEQRVVGDFGWIAGAGMGFRRLPLLKAIDAGYKFFNDTQRGKGMRCTGEDVEMCLLFRSMGYRFGFDPAMRLFHHIAPERLTLDAYKLLCRTIGAGSPGMDPFFFTTKRPPGMLPLKWTWQWQLLSKMRQFVKISLPWAGLGSGRDERRFRQQVARQQCLGSIERILSERSRYDAHIRNIASGQWTRYRVR